MTTVKLISKELDKRKGDYIHYYNTTWVVTDEEGETIRVNWNTRTPCQYHAIRQEWKKLEELRVWQQNQPILERLAKTVFDSDYQYRNRCLRGW